MSRREIDDPSKVAGATFNMTPMIDVTFQLIIVFLCSMKFRTLDQKVEVTLPKDLGLCSDHENVPPIRPILSLRLQRPAVGGPTAVVLQGSRFGSTADGDPMWERLVEVTRGFLAKSPDLIGEIDATPEVAHGEVVRALDGLVAAGYSGIRFRGTTPRVARR